MVSAVLSTISRNSTISRSTISRFHCTIKIFTNARFDFKKHFVTDGWTNGHTKVHDAYKVNFFKTKYPLLAKNLRFIIILKKGMGFLVWRFSDFSKREQNLGKDHNLVSFFYHLVINQKHYDLESYFTKEKILAKAHIILLILKRPVPITLFLLKPKKIVHFQISTELVFAPNVAS